MSHDRGKEREELPYGLSRLQQFDRPMSAICWPAGQKGERTDLDLEAYAEEQIPFEYALAGQI